MRPRAVRWAVARLSLAYVQVTGDEEFLFDEGAEMFVETARLWMSLGFYSL